MMVEKRGYLSILLGLLLLFGLYLTSLNNYLLFHSLAELFSIVVAVGIFMVSWNSRRFLENNYLLLIGIAYLFIGGMDAIHTLAYSGMGVFKGYGTNLATQLWISTRYVESLSLLIAPLLFGRTVRVNFVLPAYTAVFCLLLGSIFYWSIFPVCFVEGVGLTPFKKISEYVISLLLLGSVYLLSKKRMEFDVDVFRLLVASITLSIASELAFTFYVHAYGFSNLVGHYCKIISFYLIYKAVIQTGLSKPYDLLFRNLKQSEGALRGERDKAQKYLDIAAVMIVAIDAKGEVLLINKKGCAVLGYKEWEIVGKNWFDNFLPERLRDKVKAVSQKLMIGEIEPAKYFENPILIKNGQERIIAWHNTVLRDEAGKIIGHLSSGDDITERKLAEEKIKASLKEKEVLLGEIHHRVKNNMQVIISLLRLQAASVKDKKYSDLLKESQNRIQSMALIHEKLYRSEDFARVDFDGYVKGLARELFRSYGVDQSKIALKTEVVGVLLGLDNAIPCALIMNELVSNSLKYAFPEERKGEIEIAIHSTNGQDVELRVGDNGIGLPADLDFRNTESLGLHLVTILAEDQLGGNIELDRTGGTEFHIRFKKTEDKVRI